jgi:hypothetical protein
LLIKKIRLLPTLNRQTILLFGEAYLYLGWARILMFWPFAKIAPSLGVKTEETPTQHITTDILKLKHISHAIHIVSRYTFWESKCLVRAIAGMKMLKRRRIDSTLYLGTAKDENGKLIAHAWLRSGPLYLTGADVMNRFIVVEKFANKAS